MSRPHPEFLNRFSEPDDGIEWDCFDNGECCSWTTSPMYGYEMTWHESGRMDMRWGVSGGFQMSVCLEFGELYDPEEVLAVVYRIGVDNGNLFTYIFRKLT